jgi:hypothetical protein
MMADKWADEIRGDGLQWLLEKDQANPGPRLFALTDLCELAPDDPQVVAARKSVMKHGPVPALFDAQDPEGYWIEPGPGYRPKYKSTVWSIILLAMLGADGGDPRAQLAGDYILDHAIAKTGAFSISGAPSTAIYCLNGNLIAALYDLGWGDDPRLQQAIEWLARVTTGEGVAAVEEKEAPLRYYKGGVTGPTFQCGGNQALSCAWGALKTMLAFSRIPEAARSELVTKAIEVGIEFLFSRDPAAADYPMGWSEKPNRSWWKFGFPIFYITDMLQTLEVLCAFGYGGDSRLEAAYRLLLEKQDDEGRWPLEYSYKGKTIVDIEQKGKPSKWVTLRALRVLKRRAEHT